MATAQAQSGLNQSTATTQQLLNMTDQTNPWGSVKYDQSGSNSFVDSNGNYVNVPKFTQTTTYNPAQQQIFDQSTKAQQNIAGLASKQSEKLSNYLDTPFDFGHGEFEAGGFNPGMGGKFDPGGFNPGMENSALTDPFAFDNQSAADWSYDLASSRILPQQEKAQRALETRLVNSGIRPGTEAWDSEMSRLSMSNNDQLNQLALNGRSQAYNESITGRQQNYGETLSSAQENAQRALSARGVNFNEALVSDQENYRRALGGRQQNFTEALTERNQPLNEIASLLWGSQIANPGQASPAAPQTGVAGADYTGLVNSNYQAKVASQNAMVGGLFGLAGDLGSAAIMSDIRTKTDIKRVGSLDNGLPVYSFRYKHGGPIQIGLMAQEVEQIHPDAVHEIGGIKHVDYEMAVAA
jgi:hypothetical protein